jgi:Bacterial regulatory proteins, luxR family
MSRLEHWGLQMSNQHSTRSGRLTLKDAREVFRLIGEICELGSYPDIWQRHMLRRLNEMTDSRMSMVVQSRPPVVNNLATIVNLVDVGFGPVGMRMMHKYTVGGDYLKDPCMPATVMLFSKGRWFTRTRRQLLPDDKAWYSSQLFDEYFIPLQIDDLIWSNIFLPGTRGAHGLNFYRDGANRNPYSERDRRRIQLFHVELGRLWFKPSVQPIDKLPRRLSQTLELLRTGDSEKQIAVKMGLSPHTVHDNMKRLREHFDVSNRAGLMAAIESQQDPSAPRLSQ